MNKKLLFLLVIGASAAANKLPAQGTVTFNNLANGDSSPAATSSGLVFLSDTRRLALLNEDINFQLLGGQSAGSLIPIHTWLLSDHSANGIAVGPGHFRDPSGGVSAVSGVKAGETAILEIFAWTGNYDNWIAAGMGVGAFGTTGPFPNPTGDGGKPSDLTGMPALLVQYLPEPSPAALAALALAIFAFRRWHKQSRNTSFKVNKTLLLLLVIGASATANKLQAQGTVFLNNFDSRQGIYLYAPLPAPAGTPFEILGGPSPESLVPLLNSSGQGPVFMIEPAGVEALGPQTGSYFDEGHASVPGGLPGELAFFTLRVWLGATSWDTATERLSASWSQVIGAAGNPVPFEIPTPLGFPLPEPSSAALAGLALAIFAFRHWHKWWRNTSFKVNKKLLFLLVIGASATANKLHAQGSVFLNNYDSGKGIYLSPGVAALPGTCVEVLAGRDPSQLFPVLTSSGAGPIFTLQAAEVNALGPGSGTFFDAGAGILFDVPDYGTAFFQILAWYGGPAYYQALYQTRSAVWSQAVGRGAASPPPSPPLPVPLQIPEALGFIPEPATAALVALGLAILGIRRRHKRSR